MTGTRCSSAARSSGARTSPFSAPPTGLTTSPAQGRLSAPLNIVMRRAEVRYRADWTPERVQSTPASTAATPTSQTTFNGGRRRDAGHGRRRREDRDRRIRLRRRRSCFPTSFFGVVRGAVAPAWLAPAPAPEFPAFLGPERRRSPSASTRAHRAHADRHVARSTCAATSWRSRIRGARGREPLRRRTAAPSCASTCPPRRSTSCARTWRRPRRAHARLLEPRRRAGDHPGRGFNLGATLTRPKIARPARELPAVILLAGAGGDGPRRPRRTAFRSSGQLAGVARRRRLPRGPLRQARIRPERRPRRIRHAQRLRRRCARCSRGSRTGATSIAIASRSSDTTKAPGSALLAATRERDIAGVVTIAAPRRPEQSWSSSSSVTCSSRSTRRRPIASRGSSCRRRINAAVLTGRGWEGIPADMRKQADTPWFQSLLTFDPARDRQRRPAAAALRARRARRQVPVATSIALPTSPKVSRSRTVEVVTVRGVNHLLVPAMTGDVSEYASLERTRTLSRRRDQRDQRQLAAPRPSRRRNVLPVRASGMKHATASPAIARGCWRARRVRARHASVAVVADAVATGRSHANKGLTEVEGIRVGHYTLAGRPTGCTVVLVDGEGAVGGVSQRGGAPGHTRDRPARPAATWSTRSTRSCSPAAARSASTRRRASCATSRSGRSAGRRAAGVVPIVPAAILFDLGFGGDAEDPSDRRLRLPRRGRGDRRRRAPKATSARARARRSARWRAATAR